MERLKVLSFGILAILILGLSGVATPVSAQPQSAANGAGNPPQVTYEGNYTKIQTDQYTVIFPRNGTKPMFVWWANNETEKVYVVHYKGLIEYAKIDGASFMLKNMAEGELFGRLIHEMNARDILRMEAMERGMGATMRAGDLLAAAQLMAGMGHANRTDISSRLQEAITILQDLREGTNDEAFTAEIDQAIASINAALSMINNGTSPALALKDVRREIIDVLKAGMERTRDMIRERIAEREGLMQMTSKFHPALLPFDGTKWQLSEIQPITKDGTTIGLSFTLTLTSAPPKFDFAENNVKLAVRIYSEPVLETFSAGGQTLSYNVAEGEMKMDFIVSNWSWNFEPRTIERMNATDVTISPALALWIDASSFNATGTDPEYFFRNMEEVRATNAIQAASFSAGDSRSTIPIQAQSMEANQLNFSANVVNQRVAGVGVRLAPHAKLSLTSEGTLGGFFRFVPFATVDNGTVTVVPVGASYFEAGNHLRMYLTYPYFNGTLTHDPSIGIEGAPETPAYMVTAGTAGILSVQQIPAISTWPTLEGAGLAGVLVLVGAALVLVVVRRHPALWRAPL
ncbi:MAG: hypothetical protein FJZ49_07410 [Candidatus Verstraetearchaeota archaeon]|nr:hypothetical protein [Candidatus Verstraetearchaeota archaeon]